MTAQRVTGWVAIAFFVIFAGVILFEPDVGKAGQSGTELLALMRAHPVGVPAGEWVTGLQGMLTIVIAWGVRDRLRESGRASLGTLSVAGAATLASVVSAQHACVLALSGLARSASADPALAALLNTVSFSLETVARLPMALYVGAASLGMLAGRSFPRWLGSLGLLEALLCVVAAAATGASGPLQQDGPLSVMSLLLLLVWTLCTGICLTRARPVVPAGADQDDRLFVDA